MTFEDKAELKKQLEDKMGDKLEQKISLRLKCVELETRIEGLERDVKDGKCSGNLTDTIEQLKYELLKTKTDIECIALDMENIRYGLQLLMIGE